MSLGIEADVGFCRFRERFIKKSGPKSFKRFGTLCAGYIDAIAHEAEMRERGEVLNLQSYNEHRRQNSAIPLSFGVFEYALGIDLPDEIFEDETFMTMYWAAVDMITWSNVSLLTASCMFQKLTPLLLRIYTLTRKSKRRRATVQTTSSPCL